MSLGTVTKKPQDVLDFDVDFSRWLTEGDRIQAASATAHGGSVAVRSTDSSDTLVRVWLEGGEQNEAANVRVIVQTLQGRTKEECFRVRVKGC